MRKVPIWRSFEEARAFVHKLELKSKEQWKEYTKSGQKPPDIPSSPETAYSEFKGYGDWIGTGTLATSRRTYRPFAEARTFIHSLGLKNLREWRAYCQSGNKPPDIPAFPNEVDAYHSAFKDWGDWLGNGTVASYKHEFLPFSQARDFVHTLKLRNQDEWLDYCRSGNRPSNIPANPHMAYWLEFKGFGNWLGTGNISNYNRHYRPFVEARAFVHNLGLENGNEWRIYCQSGNKPIDIPSQPRKTYALEFKGLRDWLGYDNVSFRGRDYRPFAEARAFVHNLGLRSYKDWINYCQSGSKPPDIPYNPPRTYSSEYKDIADWLGIEKYRSFAAARAFVHTLQLKNTEEWEAYRISGEKPPDIPSNPNKVYSSEYKGMRDWLGVTEKWEPAVLLMRLYELRPILLNMENKELYNIIKAEGSLPLFRKLLGKNHPSHIIKDLKDNNGVRIEDALLNILNKNAEKSTYLIEDSVSIDEKENINIIMSETKIVHSNPLLTTPVDQVIPIQLHQTEETEKEVIVETIEIFFCYAHEDKELRDELESHLAVLKHSGQIKAWNDHLILPGTEWEHDIDEHLNSSHIILLLISSFFIGSEYCWGVEMHRALERHKAGQIRLIPIIIRPVYWQEAPFAKLQVLPFEGKPVTSWLDRHEAFSDVAKGIHKAIKVLRPQPH